MNCPTCDSKHTVLVMVKRKTIFPHLECLVLTERCVVCRESWTGWRAALAELRVIKAAADRGDQRVLWSESLQKQLDRLEQKEI